MCQDPENVPILNDTVSLQNIPILKEFSTHVILIFEHAIKSSSFIMYFPYL